MTEALGNSPDRGPPHGKSRVPPRQAGSLSSVRLVGAQRSRAVVVRCPWSTRCAHGVRSRADLLPELDLVGLSEPADRHYRDSASGSGRHRPRARSRNVCAGSVSLTGSRVGAYLPKWCVGEKPKPSTGCMFAARHRRGSRGPETRPRRLRGQGRLGFHRRQRGEPHPSPAPAVNDGRTRSEHLRRQ